MEPAREKEYPSSSSSSQRDLSGALPNFVKVDEYLSFEEYDQDAIRTLAVGSYYVRETSRAPGHYCVVAKIQETGSSDNDMLRIPIEQTAHGFKEENGYEVHATVHDLINHVARRSTNASALLIAHRLRTLFDGSIFSEGQAISLLKEEKKLHAERKVFICIPKKTHFLLLILDKANEGIQKYEYEYNHDADGFCPTSQKSGFRVCKTANDLLKQHNLSPDGGIMTREIT